MGSRDGDGNFSNTWPFRRVYTQLEFIGAAKSVAWYSTRQVLRKYPEKPHRWGGLGDCDARVYTGSLHGFAFCGAGHQVVDCVARRFTVVEDGIHLGGDGHFDAANAR